MCMCGRSTMQVFYILLLLLSAMNWLIDQSLLMFLDVIVFHKIMKCATIVMRLGNTLQTFKEHVGMMLSLDLDPVQSTITITS